MEYSHATAIQTCSCHPIPGTAPGGNAAIRSLWNRLPYRPRPLLQRPRDPNLQERVSFTPLPLRFAGHAEAGHRCVGRAPAVFGGGWLAIHTVALPQARTARRKPVLVSIQTEAVGPDFLAPPSSTTIPGQTPW